MRTILLISVLLGLSYKGFNQVVVNSPRIITQFSVIAIDEKTKEVLPAKFEIRLYKAKKTFKVANKLGQPPFSFPLYESDTVAVNTVAEGYYSYDEVLLALCDTCANYEHTVTMEKKTEKEFSELNVNDVFTLDKIYFDQSSFNLRSESYEQLGKLYRALRDNPALKIEIAGHTDNVGNAKINQYLSENRAKVIRGYLMEKGINGDRLMSVGYGQTRPVSPNDDEENRAKNRRVELNVKLKG